MIFEEEMKRIVPSFKGFYHEEVYWPRFKKCMDNFDEIIAQVPKEIKNRGYERYINTKRYYEENMKNTYVLEQRNLQLENKIGTLKNIVRLVAKVEDKGMQTKDCALDARDVIS